MGNGIIQSSAADQARQQQLLRQIASVPAEVRAMIAEMNYGSQVVVLPLPYWSTVRFQAAVASGPPVVLTVDTSERKAFSYAIGQPMTSAGFLAAAGNASEADTNLLRSTETRDNSDVYIWGLAAYITQDSEPILARRLMRETNIRIALNGTQSIPIGTLEMLPAGGGLYGTGMSFVKTPDLATQGAKDNGAGSQIPFYNNGNPMAGNFFRLAQPFKWAAVGTAGADSSLGISMTPQRTITETCGLARVAAAGVAAFTPPAAAGEIGTYVDVRIRLICVSVSKRGVNT